MAVRAKKISFNFTRREARSTQPPAGKQSDEVDAKTNVNATFGLFMVRPGGASRRHGGRGDARVSDVSGLHIRHHPAAAN